MLLGFYMTAAIACSSCAEFVRTALPTNRIVWYQVVVVSKYVVVSPIHLLCPNEAKTIVELALDFYKSSIGSRLQQLRNLTIRVSDSERASLILQLLKGFQTKN